MKKIGVVITTISNGDFLNKFIPAVDGAKGLAEVKFFIVGDLNTPPSCEEQTGKMNAAGMNCLYLTVDAQVIFLDKAGFPASHIPYRSDNRRNVGYMKAFEENCDVIISMDDDNFPVDESFFIKHARTGSIITAVPIISDTKWVNPMIFLDNQTPAGERITMYPRGFPYQERWRDNTRVSGEPGVSGTVGINVGLWTGDPDIDAISRMTTLCQSTSPSGNELNLTYALNSGHRMPINSQNTALTRDALFAYYFVKMGYQINQLKLDRFGDIFSGYFAALCTESVGHLITIGDPLVCQVRNEHNLYKDLMQELPGILLIEEMTPFLETKLPMTTSYADAYLNLAEALQQFSQANERSEIWKANARAFIDEITQIMKDWVKGLTVLK